MIPRDLCHLGPDLSSSYGGAGGIGGLVAYCDDDFDTNTPSNDPDLGPMYPIYDGNGNVVRMCRFVPSGGDWDFECRTAAAYEYGPFGEALSVTGEDLGPAGAGGQGQRNPFRFSTKYTDAETGLVYYGYRYYSPGMGRWVSRDPIEEAAGFNLAGFVVNNPTNFIDPWGLQVFRAKDTAIISYLTTVAVPGLAALLQAMNVPWFFDGSREEAAVVRARILAIQNVLVPGMNQTTNAAPPINIGTRPGALWWDTSKEHRGYILMTPWIRCDCQRVAAYGVTNQESDPGYTPARLGITTLYSAGEWHPTNRGAVSSTVVRVDEAMESVSFTQRGSSRVGGAGGLGFTQVVGSAPPFVWRDISFTIKCNGEASIKYSGSNLPNHAAYYDGRRIGRAAQEADSTPFFRHGPTEYTGSVFKTHHTKLPRDD